MRNRHVDDLVDAYALGALEPDEVDEVERHLAGCESCTALAEEARRNAELLLLTTPSVAPPPSLRARLMERIAAEKSAGSSTSAGSPSGASGGGEGNYGGTAPSVTAPEVPVAAQAAPVGYWSRVLRALRGQPLEEEHAPGDLLRDLLADPDCVVWPVAATDAAPGASARLVASRGRRNAVFVASGLRQPGAGKAYQVWLLRGGQPLPNALFRVSRGGIGAGIVWADEPWRDFDTVAVTPEPEGGSPAPTGQIVLAGSLTS